MDSSLAGSFVHGIDSPGKNTGLGIHFLLPPDPGIELVSPASSALAGGFFTTDHEGIPCSMAVNLIFPISCFYLPLPNFLCLTFLYLHYLYFF